MEYYLNASMEDFLEGDKKVRHRCKPRKAAKILLSKSNLKHSKFFTGFDSYCVYDTKKRVYFEYKKGDFILIVTQILDIAEYSSITEYDYVKKVVDNLGTFKGHAMLGVPRINPDILVFNNCIFDLESKTAKDFDPKYLVFSHVPFDYTENTEMPCFDEFLDNFCEGHEDRIKFVRCFLYTVLYGLGSMQLFFHFFGLGGSGKSTLANVAQCLVGKESCITTSLKRLSGDQFEIVNLVNKKFILIAENENWSDDTSILKNITGGDTLPGRKKHLQGSFEVNISGVLAIFNNSKFNTRDESGAIQRRIKQFRADNQVKVQKDLLRYGTRKGWEGLLVKEIPAILNWVVGLERTEVEGFLNNIVTSMPSFAQEVEASKLMFNPVISWLKDEVIPGKGLYMGIQEKASVKSEIDASQRRTLYPAYKGWCDRQGYKSISRNKLAASIEVYLREVDISGHVGKREFGQYVYGVDLKDKVFLLDYKRGAAMWNNGKEEISDKGTAGYISVPNNYHSSIGPDLREKYKGKLGETKLKNILNSVSKQMLTDDLVPGLVETYLEETKLRNPDFISSVTKQISDGVKKLRKKGAIPYKWTDCGVSPRLIPFSYGDTINFTKKVVRDAAYEIMGKEANKHGFTIVDIDITSCYLGILLGLSSGELHGIQLIVENSNIWVEIKKQFEEAGRGHLFNKRAVKICVYASYFLGGDTAMRKGIHENFRKDTGLLNKDYVKSSYYEEANKIAVDVITQMRTSEIIGLLKAYSLTLKEAYLGNNLTGPTGDTWLVTEESWRRVYPNYLISFEIALLAKSTLNVIEAYPSVEVIGHYHDGCVLMIPTDKYDEIIKYHQQQIGDIGKKLGLSFIQQIEVRRKY